MATQAASPPTVGPPPRARLLTLSGPSSPSCTDPDSRSDVAFHRHGGFPTGLVYGDGGATRRSKRLSGSPAKKKCSLFSGSPVGKGSSYRSWQRKRGHVEDEKREKKERKLDVNSFYKTLKLKIIHRVRLDLIVIAARL